MVEFGSLLVSLLRPGPFLRAIMLYDFIWWYNWCWPVILSLILCTKFMQQYAQIYKITSPNRIWLSFSLTIHVYKFDISSHGHKMTSIFKYLKWIPVIAIVHCTSQTFTTVNMSQWYQNINNQYDINTIHAKFFRCIINLYSRFKSFFHIDITQVALILPQVRKGPTYSTYSISWPLMSWRRKEPGHQQPWYWPS